MRCAARQWCASSAAAVPSARLGSSLQRLGEREVQRGPLAGEQVGVGGLLQQRVAEGVAVGVLDEHVLGHRRRAAPRPARARAAPATAASSRWLEPPAGRGGHAQHRARVVGQRLEPQVQDVAQARRQRAGGGVRRRRAAPRRRRRCPRSARAGARRGRVGGVAEDPRHLLGELGLREGLDLEALARPRGAPPRPGTGAADGGGAARRCGRCRRAAGARRAGRARARRGTRASSGRPSGGPRRRRGRATSAASRSSSARSSPKRRAWANASPVAVMPSPGSSAAWVALSSGSSRARSPPAGPTSSSKRRRLELARQPAQGGGDRRVGQAVGAEGQAVAAQHARAAGGGAALELAQQPRLAHARLAGHEHRRRRAALGPVERRLEALELRSAADELGARTRVGTWRLSSPATAAWGRFTRVPGGARPWPPRRASARRAWPGCARRGRWRSSRR